MTCHAELLCGLSTCEKWVGLVYAIVCQTLDDYCAVEFCSVECEKKHECGEVDKVAEQTYTLSSGFGHANGWVKFDWDRDVQAVRAQYEDTVVVLRNGTRYLLCGRNYGV